MKLSRVLCFQIIGGRGGVEGGQIVTGRRGWPSSMIMTVCLREGKGSMGRVEVRWGFGSLGPIG